MNERLTTRSLAELLANQTGLDRKQAEEFINTLSTYFAQGLERNKIVKIFGLGVFKILLVRERESVHIQTGERFIIPTHHKLTFMPDKDFKEQINRPFALFEPIEATESEILALKPQKMASPDDDRITDAGTFSEQSAAETLEIEEETPVPNEIKVDEDYFDPVSLDEDTDFYEDDTLFDDVVTPNDIEPEVLLEVAPQAIPDYFDTYEEEPAAPESLYEETAYEEEPAPEPLYEETAYEEEPAAPESLYEEIANEEEPAPEPLYEEIAYEEEPAPETLYEETTYEEEPAPEPLYDETAYEEEPAPETLHDEIAYEEEPAPEPEPLYEETAYEEESAPEPLYDEIAFEEEPAPESFNVNGKKNKSNQDEIINTEYHLFSSNKKKKMVFILFLIIAILIFIGLGSGIGTYVFLQKNSDKKVQISKDKDITKTTTTTDIQVPSPVGSDPNTDDVQPETTSTTELNGNLMPDSGRKQDGKPNTDWIPTSPEIIKTETKRVNQPNREIEQRNRALANNTRQSSSGSTARTTTDTNRSTATTASTSTPSTSTPSNAKTLPTRIKMAPGSSLTQIAADYYGNKVFWVYIYEHNKSNIKNFDNIPVGTELQLPTPNTYGIDANSNSSLQKARQKQAQLTK